MTASICPPLAGWLLVVLVIALVLIIMLYVRLWKSSGPSELRALHRSLADARSTIDQLAKDNLSLVNRNDFLKTQINKLESRLTAERNKLVDLAAANDRLRTTVHAINSRLEAAERRMEQQQIEIRQLNERLSPP